MADPLTLSVMRQIARKAGGESQRFEPPQEYEDGNVPHLTDSQAVLLTELIRSEKRMASPAGTVPANRQQAAKVSLEALVKSTKNR